MSVLKDLTDRAEKVRSGILTVAEDAISDHAQTTIVAHIETYLSFHQNRGSSVTHMDDIKIRLDRLVREVPIARWSTSGRRPYRAGSRPA
jgi:hypothetical protein